MHYLTLTVLFVTASIAPYAQATVSVADYESIQAAIDANPGVMIEIPPGDHFIDAPIRIGSDHTGLYGYGRIVQRNPEATILRADGAKGIRIHDITLTRAEGAEVATEHGFRADGCREFELRGVQVINNQSQAAAIQLSGCTNARVAACLVRNYQRIGVDDRTGSDLYGYAFRVIDGTGILAQNCQGVQIEGNRVVEEHIFPTQQTKEQHELGKWVEGKHPTKEGRFGHGGGYSNNWHQGSAIVVTSPLETDHVMVRGNYIENAAQGIDMHADQITCVDNSIRYAFVGIKCMHGARNVIISGNNVSRMDLWGLVMLPGTASHPAEAATGDHPVRPANFSRGNIIANNIFSDFGFGYQYFNWKESGGGVISLESGQLPENPVMRDVIIQGNIVYDTGADQVLEDGDPKTIPPRYRYAVYITPEPKPEGLLFAGNIFHPGRDGISNQEMATVPSERP